MGNQILRELSNMLIEEVQDPRLSMVTLSGVRMNGNLRIAEIFYSVGSGVDRADAQKALEKASGFLRSQLGRRIKVKFLPELRFVFDDFLEDMVYAKPSEDDSIDS